MKTTITNIKEIYTCVHYILDTEMDNFYRHPSENHVYFSALVVMDGRESALLALNEALDGVEK